MPAEMVPTAEMRFVKRVISNAVVPPLVARILQQRWVVATMPGWVSSFDSTFEWRDVLMVEEAANVSG